MKVSQKYGATIIKRPKSLAKKNALGEDVFRHGYYKVKKILQKQNKSIEQMVLLFANVATVNAELINKGVEFLRKNIHLKKKSFPTELILNLSKSTTNLTR